MNTAVAGVVAVIVFSILILSYREYKEKEDIAAVVPVCKECCTGCPARSITCSFPKSDLSDFYSKAVWLTNGKWLGSWYNRSWDAYYDSQKVFDNWVPWVSRHTTNLFTDGILDLELLGNPVLGPYPKDDLLVVAKILLDNSGYPRMDKGNIFVDPWAMAIAHYPDRLAQGSSQRITNPSVSELISRGIFKSLGISNPYSMIQIRFGDSIVDTEDNVTRSDKGTWGPPDASYNAISSVYLHKYINHDVQDLWGFSFPAGPSFFYDSGRNKGDGLAGLIKQ